MLPLNNRWDEFFFSLCKTNAGMSKDPSTKVGSVIVRPDRTVVSMGWNGFPKRSKDSENLYSDREIKYQRIIHAEMNAIIHAREPLHGCTLYSWPLGPCERCMPHIIQAGIIRVVSPEPSLTRPWGHSQVIAADMAEEAGVQIITRSL